jgi:hypothetical protein
MLAYKCILYPTHGSFASPRIPQRSRFKVYSRFLLPSEFLMANAAGFLARSDTLVARAGGVHPPPEVLLNWPNPNFVNPEKRGWEAPIVLIVMLAVTTVIYLARLWARLVVARNFGLDDILMSVAMLPVFGLTISTILGESYVSQTSL